MTDGARSELEAALTALINDDAVSRGVAVVA